MVEYANSRENQTTALEIKRYGFYINTEKLSLKVKRNF